MYVMLLHHCDISLMSVMLLHHCDIALMFVMLLHHCDIALMSVMLLHHCDIFRSNNVDDRTTLGGIKIKWPFSMYIVVAG